MGPSPILSVIPPVTIDTMLNKNGPLLYDQIKTLHDNQTRKPLDRVIFMYNVLNNKLLRNNTHVVKVR